MATKGGKWRGGGVCVMNWEIVIDRYTLMCIKLMTNKNLLYKRINKIKSQNSKKKSTNNICWRGCGEKGTLLLTLLVGM